MGGLKESYLNNEEGRYLKLAKSLGITWEELLLLEYEIEASISKDGLIYNYSVVFGDGCDAEILKKISSLNGNAVYLSPTFFDDREVFYDSYELNAILGGKDHRKNYFEEIENLNKLLALDISDKGLKLILYRQIFVSVIGSMETFLSDTFINEALSSEHNLRRFVENHPDFKRQKINLSEIYSESLKIKENAKNLMIGTIYHKLFVVKNMYEQTFEISFPDISKMQKYVSVRHDLVHRNGKTVDGEAIWLEEKDILDLFDTTTHLINEISNSLEDRPF